MYHDLGGLPLPAGERVGVRGGDLSMALEPLTLTLAQRGEGTDRACRQIIDSKPREALVNQSAREALTNEGRREAWAMKAGNRLVSLSVAVNTAIVVSGRWRIACIRSRSLYLLPLPWV